MFKFVCLGLLRLFWFGKDIFFYIFVLLILKIDLYLVIFLV